MDKVEKIISEKINQLRLLDLEDADYNEIVMQVRELLTLASEVSNVSEAKTLVFNLKKGERLYRAHFKHSDPAQTKKNTPTYLKSILAPDKDLVKGYQRCNPPREPMFYAATCRERALRECRAEVGDLLFLSEWEVKKDLIITAINPISSGQISQNYELLYNFFADKFIQRIHETFSYEYKLTAAITQVLLEVKKKENMQSGICYPSVVSRMRGENFALLPEAQTNLTPIQVDKIEITNMTNIEYTWNSTERVNNFAGERVNWSFFEQSIIFPNNFAVIDMGNDDVSPYAKLSDGRVLRPTIREQRGL